MLMPRETRRPATAIAAALVLSSLLLAGGAALAEINLEDHKPTPPPIAKTERAPVQVQCWQEGVKIIDETGLTEMTLSNFLTQVSRPSVVDGDAVGLKGRDDKGGKVLIVSVRDATCLVRDAS